jgi:N,N'-diacetyllegionaminate synthase
MACSHDSEPSYAKKIIDAAGKSGANAIQFQIWLADDLMVPYHSQFDFHKNLELSRDEWKELANYVRSRFPSMEIIACVYEKNSVDFSESISVDAYKIHSSDLSNEMLLKHVARKGKRIDLSVGASTISEIEDALETIRKVSNVDVWIMYGIQNFPTPSDEIHLAYMMKLKKLFELPIGYQDHCDGDSEAGYWLPAAAIGMGVDIIEKHITHDRSFKGVDYEAALDPDQFKKFAEMVREIDAARGISIPKPFTEAEQTYRRYAKKRLVAGKDIKAGEKIVEDDLLFMRAEELAMTPDQANLLIGKKATKDIKKYELFKLDYIA